jgi:tetratricopeptide (TPR) repeat protein
MSRIDQIQKMLAAEPKDAFLNFGLAMEYAKSGRHDDALAQFAHTVEVDPAYLTAYMQWASLLVSLKRHSDAKAIFNRGLAVARASGNQHAVSEITEALSLLG